MPTVFRQERISFYPKIAIISCFRTAVLIYVRKVIRMNAESSLRSELTISSYFLSSCLGLRVLGSKPQPELSTRQQQHRQSPRCPASVCLQDSKTERTYKYTWVNQYNINPDMEISGNHSTKSYGTQREAINKVIWYAAASNQRSHMVLSGNQSTKSYGTQRQVINKVIWYSATGNQQSHKVRSGK